ncbi:flexirubin biosynthesis protein [Bacteroidia bacterium]|nr:flexirubin biosynthesis protein [Bacteroidia bacterium]
MNNFEEIDILGILPQRLPFVTVDKLLHFDFEVTRTSYAVKADTVFCDDGRFTESGLIENIAQTCAARIGYINKYINHKEITLGFIGAIRNLEILRLPQTGELLTTQIIAIKEVFQMTLVNATVTAGEELIASCEMKIATTEIMNNEQ